MTDPTHPAEPADPPAPRGTAPTGTAPTGRAAEAFDGAGRAPPKPRLRFGRAVRLQHRNEFSAVFGKKCSVRDGVLLVFVGANGRTVPRLGLSVSRKVGGAVVRNAWKRRIREAFRLERPGLPAGFDFVVIPGAKTVPTLAALRGSLRDLARRGRKRWEKMTP